MPLAVAPDRFIGKATAMMDISDGLCIDLSRLCKESGVGARVYADKIPLSKELKKTAEYLGVDPIDFATGGGEDYELLFTAPASAKVDAFCIGAITGRGLRMVSREGKSQKISIRGYQHFAL
jgi:thiamine-monophosphate kinase